MPSILEGAYISTYTKAEVWITNQDRVRLVQRHLQEQITLLEDLASEKEGLTPHERGSLRGIKSILVGIQEQLPKS